MEVFQRSERARQTGGERERERLRDREVLLTVAPAQQTAPVQLETFAVAVRRARGLRAIAARQEVRSPGAAAGGRLGLVQLHALSHPPCFPGLQHPSPGGKATRGCSAASIRAIDDDPPLGAPHPPDTPPTLSTAERCGLCGRGGPPRGSWSTAGFLGARAWAPLVPTSPCCVCSAVVCSSPLRICVSVSGSSPPLSPQHAHFHPLRSAKCHFFCSASSSPPSHDVYWCPYRSDIRYKHIALF